MINFVANLVPEVPKFRKPVKKLSLKSHHFLRDQKNGSKAVVCRSNRITNQIAKYNTDTILFITINTKRENKMNFNFFLLYTYAYAT